MTAVVSTPSRVSAVSTGGPAARVRRKLNTRAASVVSIIIAVLWTTPTFGLFISSFRPEQQIKTTGWWTFFADPQVTLENYREVLFGRSASSGQLAGYFINSLVITIPSVLFPLAFAALAAYALAWINFRGRDWIYIRTFALQTAPLQTSFTGRGWIYSEPVAR